VLTGTTFISKNILMNEIDYQRFCCFRESLIFKAPFLTTDALHNLILSQETPSVLSHFKALPSKI